MTKDKPLILLNTPAEDLTVPAESGDKALDASGVSTAIEWLKKVYALGVSEGSVVPQKNAGEMLARLDELGFGKQEPRRGNTLWAMVMDAADEIEKLRADSVAAMCGCGDHFTADFRGTCPNCIAAQGSVADWQPIGTAPRDRRLVLACMSDGSMAVMYADVTDYHGSTPTRWMPLPAPPSLRTDKGEEDPKNLG